MDWNDPDLPASLWVYPRGMNQDGGVGERSLAWKSKYGSVFVDFYNAANVDGINEKGLVANVLYLAEADYGDPATSQKPQLSIGAWAQYYLDNFAAVEEAVKATGSDEFTVVSPMLPNGRVQGDDQLAGLR
jgi:choloylglycine hydrolase